MEELDTRLTRNIAIPSWMVLMITAVLTSLIAGAVGTVWQDRNRVTTLEQQHAAMSSELAAQRVKHDDILNAINGMRKDFVEIEKKLDARMP